MPQDKNYYKKCHRYDISGHAHELTFSCYRRREFLSRQRTCDWLVESVDRARQKYCFSLWAYVFMPEHVHMLICPEAEEYSIARILQSIKQPVSQKAIGYLKRNNPDGLQKLATGQNCRTHRFWQDGGGYDRNIIKEETIINAVRYIHCNPVRRSLVENPEQWYYSSAGAWQGDDGPLKIDFDTYPIA